MNVQLCRILLTSSHGVNSGFLFQGDFPPANLRTCELLLSVAILVTGTFHKTTIPHSLRTFNNHTPDFCMLLIILILTLISVSCCSPHACTMLALCFPFARSLGFPQGKTERVRVIMAPRKKYIVIQPSRINKGKALLTIMHDLFPSFVYDLILVVGDERTDEAM